MDKKQELPVEQRIRSKTTEESNGISMIHIGFTAGHWERKMKRNGSSGYSQNRSVSGSF